MRSSPMAQPAVSPPSGSESSEAHRAVDRSLPERLALACHLLADIRDFLVSPELPMVEELIDLAIERIIIAQEQLPAIPLLTYSVEGGYPKLLERKSGHAAAPLNNSDVSSAEQGAV